MELDRATYASVYGATTGDRLRLGDTDLVVEVEADDNPPGLEPLIGFGKTIRADIGMAMSLPADEAPDVVVTNVVLIDPVRGVRKTSIGIKDGRIVSTGRAGNPETMEGVEVPIGPSTGVIPGEGMIATPGAIDSHIHLSSTNVAPAALAGGVTTFVAMGYGGAFDLGIGPAANLHRLLEAWRAIPINLLPLVRASSNDADRLEEALATGAGGFKVHEDTGAYPDIIDAALRVADRQDVQVAMHLDGSGETATLNESLEAIGDRVAHLYHVEGCGGGPIDLLEVAGRDNVLPSSTNPTVPYGATAVAEHEVMISTVHRLHPAFANDAQAAQARVRGWTMAAESVLHDVGAISIMSSDSLGMGRVGETVRRTFQLADVMKRMHGSAGSNDNERVLRYLAKLTINPAIAHGISHDLGSLEVGKLADIVLWRPAFFAVKPQQVIKKGFSVYAPQGSGDAATRLGEPRVYGPMFGGIGAAPQSLSTVFSSAIGRDALAAAWGGPTGVVRDCRSVRKGDLVRNGETPEVRVDAAAEAVFVDGDRVEMEPVAEVPLNRAYFLT